MTLTKDEIRTLTDNCICGYYPEILFYKSGKVVLQCYMCDSTSVEANNDVQAVIKWNKKIRNLKHENTK
jgi:hypothetical protein